MTTSLAARLRPLLRWLLPLCTGLAGTTLAGVALIALTGAVWAGTALAAAPGMQGTANPGVRLGEWVQANVAALFPPILGLMALYYLVRREFSQFLSFAVFATLASLLVYAGESFRDAAVGLGRWLVGR